MAPPSRKAVQVSCMLSFPVLSAAKELATRGLIAKQKAALGWLPPPVYCFSCFYYSFRLSAGKLHVVLSGLISRKGTCHKGAECQTESSAREAAAAGSCQVYGQASHRWQRRLGEREIGRGSG